MARDWRRDSIASRLRGSAQPAAVRGASRGSLHVSPEHLATVDDSPMLRRSLQAYMNDVEESRDAVTTFLKNADTATRVGLEYADALKAFAESSAVTGARLNTVWNHDSASGTSSPWLDVARALSLYGASLTEQSSLTRQHMAQLTSSWQALRHRLQPAALAALRQRFDRASQEQQAAVQAHLAMQRSGGPQPRLDEAAGRAERATWVLEQCRFNYVTALNRAEHMHVQLMESVGAAFASHLEAAEMGLDQLSSMRAEMAPVRSAARAARLGLGQDEERMITQRIERLRAEGGARAAGPAAADSDSGSFGSGRSGDDDSGRLVDRCAEGFESSTRRCSEGSVSASAAAPAGVATSNGAGLRPRRSSIGRRNAQRGVVTEIQGYLLKQSSSVRADWKRRFFFLTAAGELHYCRSEADVDSPKSMGSLLLISARPISTQHSPHGGSVAGAASTAGSGHDAHTFIITSPYRRHTLQAESEKQLREWLAALQNATAALLTAQNFSAQQQLGSAAANGAAGGGARAGDAAAGAPTPPLQLLLGVPGNEVCVECLELRPDWCSLNLGVTLCLECSGIHRSLGVATSKVRSLTLDALSPSQLAVLAALGNEKSRRVWEACLSTNGGGGHGGGDSGGDGGEEEAGQSSSAVARPTRDSSRAVREAWIRTKYVERRFVLREAAQLAQMQAEMMDAAGDGDAGSGDAGGDAGGEAGDGRGVGAGDGGSDGSGSSGVGTPPSAAPSSAEARSGGGVAELLSECVVRAAARGVLPRIAELLAWGATCDREACRGGKKGCALHHAAAADRTHVAQLLLLNGAEVDLQCTEDGSTPLHWSCGADAGNTALLLLEHGGSPKQLDAFGRTPLDVAMSNGKLTSAELLAELTDYD
tara:strand:+ start:144 stop:2777 length:2634 start_codon:yes stop_codon:yes gene_type:complete